MPDTTAATKPPRPTGWIPWLKRRLIILAALEVVLLTFPNWLASQFILFPSTHPQEIGMAERRRIPYAGGQLDVIFARSPGCEQRPPRAIVVSFQGNEQNRDRHGAGPGDIHI